MEIRVNGEPRTVAPGLHLGALLDELGVPRDAVAVAVNLAVVPRGEVSAHPLAEGDRVEVVRAVGGG